MNVKVFNSALALAGCIGAGLFGYSLIQQTELQSGMNEKMALINQSIAATGALVKETSDVLEPLTATTAALTAIQQREAETVQFLNSMNQHLSNTANNERIVIQALEALNTTSSGVSGQLSDMGQITEALQRVSGITGVQASVEEQNVRALNGMTQTSIDELSQLNEKLYPLRLLP